MAPGSRGASVPHASSRCAPRRSIASAFDLFDKFNAAFAALDLDGDGTISVAELGVATQRLSLSQQVSSADELALQPPAAPCGTLQHPAAPSGPPCSTRVTRLQLHTRQVSEAELALLVSQFDLNDNGSSAPCAQMHDAAENTTSHAMTLWTLHAHVRTNPRCRVRAPCRAL